MYWVLLVVIVQPGSENMTVGCYVLGIISYCTAR